MKKKKFIILCVAFFACLLIATFGIVISQFKTSYTLEKTLFNHTFAYNEELDLDNLTIVKQRGSKKETIYITSDMIVSGGDTNKVGTSQLVIKYENKTFFVDITVKYKVEFVVNGDVISTQYVLSDDEIIYPADPKLDGCEFVEWSASNYVVTNNTVFYARFKLSNVNAFKFDATYGDKLSDIELPSNQYGEWKFIDDLSTSVGDANSNYKDFEVEFVPYNLDCVERATNIAKIKVAKKKIEIKNIQTQFIYDGSEKTPTYEIDVDGVNVNYIPYFSGKAINAGTYPFELDVSDTNYSADSYSGSFKISKVEVHVEIDDIEIALTDPYPDEFKFVVYEGKNVNAENKQPLASKLVELMGIEITKPYFQHAGNFVISAKVSNNNFDYVIVDGQLKVNKGELNLDETPPNFVNGAKITYGNLLSSVEFINDDVRGVWQWKDSSIKVLTPTSIVAKAEFIPYENNDYIISEKDVTLEVEKKKLTIEVLENNYVYDGLDHSVNYNVRGLEDGEFASILGNIVEKTAGEYEVTLAVDVEDERYTGSTKTELVIEQKSIADFSTKYSKEWNKTLTLANIPLNDGYSWVNPLTPITQVGEQKYLAQFTPNDIVNYKTEQACITINVYKANASIQSPEVYEFEYNPKGYVLTEIELPHCEAELEYEYVKNGEKVSGITSVGEYSVEMTLAESEHYVEISKTIKVVVNKAINQDTIVQNREATYGDLLSKFTLPTSNFGNWIWKGGSNSTVGFAGEQVYVAQFIPTDKVNYESREVEVVFNVAKQIVQVPTIQSKIFNNQTQVANISSNSYYNVLKNDGGIVKGEYNVVLELLDSDNYCWSGEYTDFNQITLPFEIIKNTSNVWEQTPKISNWQYGQVAKTPSAKARFGEVVVEYKPKNGDEYSTVVPNVAGSYLAKFTVDETPSYNGLEYTVEFSIAYIVVQVPAIPNKVYNGTGQVANVPVSSQYDVVSNEERTDAGEYKVIIELNNNSYKWPDSYELQRELIFVIEKVKNSDNVITLIDAVYGDLLEKFVLPESSTGTWKWAEDNDVSVGSVGTQTHLMIFEPTDPKNYEKREQLVTFNIAKQVVQLPTIEAKTYNGEVQVAIISSTETYTVIANNGGINMGKYDVVLELNDSANYRWAGLEDEKCLTLTFNITKSEANKWMVEPAISGWKYGEEATTPVAESLFGDVKVEYKLKADSDDNYSEKVPAKAGTYVAKFSVDETQSYNGLSKTVEFKIDYITVALPTIQSRVYNGEAQIAEIAQSDKYTVLTETLSFKNAGSYEIVIQLNNESYKWNDSYELTRTLMFNITKVQNTDEVTQNYQAVYDDKLSKFDLPENENGKWVWVDGAEATVGNAGNQKHVAKFIPADKLNYEFREVEVTFDVSKQVIQLPIIEAKAYNGEVQVANISSTEIYTVITNNGGVNMGEYDVVLELNDSANYRWAGLEYEKQLTLKFKISKNANNVWVKTPAINGWKYGEEPNTPVAESLYGDVVVEYKLKTDSDDNYSTAIPKKAGTYIAKFIVEETNEYNGLNKTVEFNIEYIVVNVPTIAESTYSGSNQTANIEPSEYYDVVSNEERLNAGEYDVVIKLNNDSYKWPDSYELIRTLKFKINKVINEDTFETYNAIYEDVLGDHALVENSTGEWTWKTGDETSVGTAGKHVHFAVFTPNDPSNYESREVEITFEVAKKELETPEVESKVYNGEVQTSELDSTSLYSVVNASGTNKGEYDVQVTLTDFANYCWKDDNDSETVVVKFNILKNNDNKWVETPSITGWAFGEDPNVPKGVAVFGEDIVEYKLKTDSVDKYSTTIPKKAGTYMVRFIVEETDNFNGLTHVVEFNIEYIVVNVPTIAESTYSGSNQTANIEPSEYYDVVSNEERLNAGEYDVVIKLNNDSYKWPDSYELIRTLKFKINKVINEDTFETYNAIYEDVLGDHALVENSTGEWTWKTGDETSVGTAGKHVHFAVFTPNDPSNYESREVEITFEVAKKELETPEVESKVYNGEVQTSELDSTSLYSVVNASGTNKGEYDVQVTLADFANYCWKDDNDSQTINATFNILKYTENDWEVMPFIAGWTYYEDEPSSPVGRAEFGDLVAEYKLQTEDDTKYSTTIPENVGSYKTRFSVEDTENYNGLAYVYVDFVIDYFEVDVPTIESTTYKGSSQKANVATSEYYDITLNANYVDAGEYAVIVKLKNSNFKWTDSYELEKELTFVIEKATDNSWTNGPTMNSFVYTPTYNNANEGVATAKYGTVMVKYLENSSYLNGLPTNVGTYTAEFTIADCDNYNGLSKTIDFNITQATPDVSGLQISTVAYENSSESVILNSLTSTVDGNFIFDAPVLATTSNASYNSVGFNVTFTPADAHNYKTLTDMQATINLYSVCYSGSTYYGSIENALEKVTSGTVTVIPNTSRNISIAKDAIINSGVTLSLPYLAENGSYSVNNTNGKATLHLDAGSSETDKDNAVSHTSDLKLTTRVVIKNGVTLTNNGTLMIAGETSGGRGGSGLAGHTARNFAEFEMEPNAKIISTGTIHCFGFIDVSDLNNTSSQVIIQSGTLYMPFVIADFRGGTFMKEAYQDLSTTPFNQFELRNIVASLRINQGAVLIGHGNLYAQTLSSYIGGLLGGLFGGGSSSKSDNNYAEVKLIGNDKNYLIQLTSGGYVEGKYNPIRESVDNNNQWTDGINNLNFYGGAKTNSLKMKVVSVTLNTSSVAFPLSWRFKIGLNNGSYSMGNTFKMMPGAELTVQKGATLTVDTLNIYDANWSDTAGVSSQTEYKASAGAPKLIVRGTLISNDALGGIVYSDTNDAIVQVKGSISVSTNEVIGKSGDKYTASAVSNSLCLKSATNIDEAISTGTFASSVDGESSSTYKMVNGVWVKQT